MQTPWPPKAAMMMIGKSEFVLQTLSFDQSLDLQRNYSDSESGASSSSPDGEAEEGDVDMKPSDPTDLTAYNLDTYDEEESRGAGE